MSLTLTPTVTASSAYAAGACVGGLLNFTHDIDSSLEGILESVSISVKSIQTTAFKLYTFSALPSNSTFTDKVVPAINAADVPLVTGVYQFPVADSGLGTMTIYNLDAIAKALQLASRSVYAVLVAVGTPTFASASDVIVTLLTLPV